MGQRTWVRQKTIVCERTGRDVALEVEVALPAEVLPDQAPRVLAHRCSYGVSCNSLDRPMCSWAGSLPGYDPFA
jgi:hypothetical protein